MIATSRFKLKNVKPSIKSRPVASGLIGLFIIYNAVALLQLAMSDLTTHPVYVVTKLLILIAGSMIWLNGLKSGNLSMTFLKYIGFMVIAMFVQFMVYAGSYGEVKHV